MNIKAFHATRPPAELAARVASPPYDVVDVHEARLIADGNPYCFLRIVRSELELAQDLSPYDDQVYQRALDNFCRFKMEGVLARSAQPALYAYQLTQGDHQQTGLVTLAHIQDYDQGRIKRHEKTRQITEDDRTRHVDTLNANTGPVFLTYRDETTIDALMQSARSTAPLYDFAAVDGIRHTVWEITDTHPLVDAFAKVPVAYVADGHHRAASAARVARQRRDADPSATGEEPYLWFLTVYFPASQLRVLPYNRVVQDLHGATPESFLDSLRRVWQVESTDVPVPDAPGSCCMYLRNQWYRLRWTAPDIADPVASLDVSVLQDQVLAPLLNIEDPRTNSRIAFVGGVRGTGELMRRVDRGQAAVAFSMYPVSMEQLMRVADADLIMPPKSTWFEPKLRSGLLLNELS